VKIEWDAVPLWPFYMGLYVVAGFVVARSLTVETRRQCAASSIPRETKLLAGAVWPVTAAAMIVGHLDPFAALTHDPNEPPNT
jgi:hypothetical protein